MSERKTKNKTPWNLIDMLIIFTLAYLIVMVAGRLTSYLVKEFLAVDQDMNKTIVVLSSILFQNVSLVGLGIILVKQKYNFPIFKKLFSFKNKSEIILNGIIGGLAILFSIMIINGILASILYQFFGYKPPLQQVMVLLYQSKNVWVFLSYSILIVIAAPLGEEFFFRGMVYNYFKEKFGFKTGIILSASLFSLLHFHLWALPGIFLGGIALAYLYEKSDSIITSILAHMTWNGIVTLISFLVWKGSITIQ
mgnify:FL=1